MRPEMLDVLVEVAQAEQRRACGRLQPLPLVHVGVAALPPHRLEQLLLLEEVPPLVGVGVRLRVRSRGRGRGRGKGRGRGGGRGRGRGRGSGLEEGLEGNSPPPRSTSGPLLASCSAIDLSRLRRRACAAKAAGVGPVTEEVTARPVTIFAALAASMSVAHGRSRTSTATYVLLVFRPQLNADAPAAESVMRWSAERVCI